MLISLVLAAAAACGDPPASLGDFLFTPPRQDCAPAVEPMAATARTRILAGPSGREIHLLLTASDGRETAVPIAVCAEVDGDPGSVKAVIAPMVCDDVVIRFDLTADGIAVWSSDDDDAPALSVALPPEVSTVNGHLRPEPASP